MPAKKSSLIGNLPDKVILADDYSGSEPFDVKGFTLGKAYKPFAMFTYGFSDGCTELVFSVPDDNGRIRTVAATKFQIPKGETQ
jgi:hypothetical protein